ncbi:hypothetical protein PSQ40_21085 [Curvibacter sp. HBC61]|uniref:DUF3313 domain-containing protein n=1 Tax=Curvibacter cyanobacteriorum TaxID=3026422 RepID=A0ABT5N6I3_9BURK|nr:hypothetical protein [Curvibacter sp. HBC61]MDD0841086.1 hypothetical protein [Curvibacter sp. HBC61]
MNQACWIPLLLGGALLGGCSTLDVPRADNYPVSSQKKARSVHHWDVLADDVAKRVADKIRSYPMALPPVYLVQAPSGSFNQSFRELLLTRLVNHGAIVSRQPGPLVLRFETQLIEHGSEVGNSNPLPLVTLSAGVSVTRDLYNYAHSTTSYVGSALGLAALADLGRLAADGPAAGGPTRSEVLITTSLEREDTFLARTADVYYIERDDTRLYLPVPDLPPVTPPAAPPTRNWKVVGQ